MKINVISASISLILIISTTLSSLPANASYNISTKIIYVDDDGGAEYTNIQSAINNADEYDTIFVYNGTYYETLDIDIPLTLIGESNQNTIIDGEQEHNNVITINADNVSINGFTVRNGFEPGLLNEANIHIFSSNCTIENNIIDNNNPMNFFGIYLHDYTYPVDCLNNKIISNVFIDQNLFLLGTNNNTISNNIFIKSHLTDQDGIMVISSHNNSIYNNSFSGKFLSSLELDTASNNLIYNNNISGRIKTGIGIYDDSDNNDIHHNNILNCTCGIFIEKSKYNKIHENNINKCLIKAYSWFSPFNCWYKNYWGRPRILPKRINGVGSGMIFYRYDWRPSLIPNEI
ncbi:MAG: right-handed parallel beta-helix repeat-containing protein [Thermoplasmatales archaeon]|nr:right-handed parallel beta-helix repeat-containing protein [Thermoplasmatales archaeon]